MLENVELYLHTFLKYTYQYLVFQEFQFNFIPPIKSPQGATEWW